MLPRGDTPLYVYAGIGGEHDQAIGKLLETIGRKAKGTKASEKLVDAMLARLLERLRSPSEKAVRKARGLRREAQRAKAAQPPDTLHPTKFVSKQI